MEHRGQLWVSGIENMFAGPPEDRFLDLDRHPLLPGACRWGSVDSTAGAEARQRPIVV